MASLGNLRGFDPRVLLVSILVSILGACASITEQVMQSPPDWDERVNRHAQINDWTIKARLGVQTEFEGGSFDVFWQQQGENYDIRLVAPMGRGAVQITGDNGGVRIALADGQTQYSDNPDELFATMTGLSLPVTGLHDWLRGMPIREQPIQAISWNQNSQLYKIEQRGWRVEMDRYRAVADYELPHAFYLQREDQPDLSVRLLVREWRPDVQVSGQ